MAPAKRSSPRKTKSSASSTLSSSLKQGRLDFSARRGSSTTSINGKGKGKTSATASPSVEISKSNTPIELDDAGEEVEKPTAIAGKGKKMKGSHVTKKRKLGLDVTEGDAADAVGPKGTDVFRPREGIENAESIGNGVDTRPELNPADKKWRKIYGEARKKMGSLQPIHAEGQNKIHHILRVFDLSYEYGPCVGVTRLERWERAQALGLNPPPEVKEILLTKQGTEKDEYSQCVFYDEV